MISPSEFFCASLIFETFLRSSFSCVPQLLRLTSSLSWATSWITFIKAVFVFLDKKYSRAFLFKFSFGLMTFLPHLKTAQFCGVYLYARWAVVEFGWEKIYDCKSTVPAIWNISKCSHQFISRNILISLMSFKMDNVFLLCMH